MKTRFLETKDGIVYEQFCTRIQDWKRAYTLGAVSHGVAFPGRMIRAETVDALNKAIGAARVKGIVWA